MQSSGTRRRVSTSSMLRSTWFFTSPLPTCRHQLDVALAQHVVDHVLILLDQHGAGGVHDVAARLGVGIRQVNGGQQQLLLQVRAAPDVVLRLAGLWWAEGDGESILW